MSHRDRSLWLDQYPGPLDPRPTLPGDAAYDVAIVGAGFTGLWAAYYLTSLQPDLRVVVVEQEIAGFGASGRNGGWASGFIAGTPSRYAKKHGPAAVLSAERATFAAVHEIERVVRSEAIDCGFVRSGSLTVATSAPQLSRLEAGLAGKRARGIGEDDLRSLSAAELEDRVRVADALGATFTPHCARMDPARLVRGLAEAVEGQGAVIHEQTTATRVERGRVVCRTGTITADHVLMATEAFTTRLPGQARRFLPLYSLMVATEPLVESVWDELGWAGLETIADLHHLFFYAQRTTDNRIAIGGRGAPYRLGSPISEAGERDSSVRERLGATIRRAFPAAGGAELTHHWGGALAVPRDWCMAIVHDPATGLGWAGGYSGHGVVGANLSGRTLADLVLRRDTELTALPWVGHRSRSWEPEPLRFLASRSIVTVLDSADRHEDATGRTARRTSLLRPFVPER